MFVDKCLASRNAELVNPEDTRLSVMEARKYTVTHESIARPLIMSSKACHL
jgi:hypothetical protein